VRTVKVTGRAGLPATGVGAVAVNITSVNQDQSSFLTVIPNRSSSTDGVGAQPNTTDLSHPTS